MPPSTARTRPVVQLLIQLSPNGDVEVRGPIDDDLFCYGLMEKGRQAIQAYQERKQSPLLLPPSARVGRRPALVGEAEQVGQVVPDVPPVPSEPEEPKA